MKGIGIIAFVEKYYKKEIERETEVLIKRGVESDFAKHRALILIATRRLKDYDGKSEG